MRHFRAISDDMHVNRGWVECWAPSPQAAIADFIGRGWCGGAALLYEKVNGWWAPYISPGIRSRGYIGYSYEYLWRQH
jgi:hypothetical protein